VKKKRNRKIRWYVFVAEVKPKSRKVNPIASLPVGDGSNRHSLHVGYIRGERPEKRFPEGDFSSARKGSILKKRGVRILPEFTSYHTSKIGYLGQQLRVVERLKADGLSVVNREPAKTHSVYVIELKPEVADFSGVKKRKPDRNQKKRCVYVGQTKKTPEERYLEHISGVRSGRHVNKETAIGLMPEEFGHLNPLTELDSLRAERKLAHKLRKEGCTVLGGH